MRFFQTFILSLTSPSFYEVLPRSPASRSFAYFAKLQAFLALFLVLPFIGFLLVASPRVPLEALTDAYPEDLIVTLKDGTLSINQDLPYAIPLPARFREELDRDDDRSAPSRLVVFTQEEEIGSLSSFLALDAFIVVTEKAMYMREDGMRMRSMLLPSFADATVTHATLEEGVDSFLSHWFVKYRLYIIPLAGALFLVLWITSFLGHLVLLLIYTLLLWILTSLFLRNQRLTYTGLYQIGLHSMSLIIVVGAVFSLFGATFFHGIVQLLAFLAWTIWLLTERTASRPVATIDVQKKQERPAPKKQAKKKASSRQKRKGG